MRRPLRLIAYTVAGLLLLAAVALFVAIYVVLQPRRFTAMLQEQARSAGLELTLASPASPDLWPTPALELVGINLRAQGGNTPLLLAAQGRLVLPWATLLGRESAISRLELDAPRVDLDALSDMLARLPARPAGAPPYLPRIDAGFSISRGTVVRANRLLLSDVQLDAGSLVPGQLFSLRLSARGANGTPYTLNLETTPQLKSDALVLDDVRLDAASTPLLDARLAGDAQWRGGADISAQLAGKLNHGADDSYDLNLVLTPANQVDPLSLAVKLDSADNHVDVRLPPLELGDWWAQAASMPGLTLPPFTGSIDAAKLDLGDIHIKGLKVRAGVPNEPEPAASTAAPSPVSGKKP
jgi:AsmA family